MRTRLLTMLAAACSLYEKTFQNFETITSLNEITFSVWVESIKGILVVQSSRFNNSEGSSDSVLKM